MMEIRLHPAADRELSAAASYYAHQVNRELAENFLAEFDRSVTILYRHPKWGSPWQLGTRRFPLRRFPYSIVYVENAGEQLQILAVAHQRKKPGYWHSRR